MYQPVNRLEAFSDAVFAVSATLLVVSLEVPESLPALLDNLAGFAGFAFSFTMLILIWVEHNRFFRRFGLQDAMTIFLNSVLLFVVLFCGSSEKVVPDVFQRRKSKAQLPVFSIFQSLARLKNVAPSVARRKL